MAEVDEDDDPEGHGDDDPQGDDERATRSGERVGERRRRAIEWSSRRDRGRESEPARDHDGRELRREREPRERREEEEAPLASLSREPVEEEAGPEGERGEGHVVLHDRSVPEEVGVSREEEKRHEPSSRAEALPRPEVAHEDDCEREDDEGSPRRDRERVRARARSGEHEALVVARDHGLAVAILALLHLVRARARRRIPARSLLSLAGPERPGDDGAEDLHERRMLGVQDELAVGEVRDPGAEVDHLVVGDREGARDRELDGDERGEDEDEGRVGALHCVSSSRATTGRAG